MAPSAPPHLFARQFWCEHSKAKTRGLALITGSGGPPVLEAVLTSQACDDHDWRMCLEVFFQDHDVLMLDDHSLDGIDDPSSRANQFVAAGDLRPGAWYERFDNVEPRDPSRGFRR